MSEHMAERDAIVEVLADHIWTPRKKGPAEARSSPVGRAWPLRSRSPGTSLHTPVI